MRTTGLFSDISFVNLCEQKDSATPTRRTLQKKYENLVNSDFIAAGFIYLSFSLIFLCSFAGVIQLVMFFYVHRADLREVELKCRPEVLETCIVLGRIESTEGDSITVPNVEQWQKIDNILTVEPSQSAIFPSAIFTAFPSLSKVHIIRFGIRVLHADTFSNASHLVKISLEDNIIESVSKNVFSKCAHLIELDLSKNIIRHIDDDAFSGLVNLKILHMNNNNLTAVRWQMVSDMVSLEQINLERNAIESIEEKTFDLPKLKTIFMSENRLKTLPGNLFGPNVETIDLRNNRITNTGNAFANASQPLVILLNCNPLKDLNLLQFLRMPELHGLSIADTGLTVDKLESLSTLPDNVKSNVKFLDVSQNKLSNRNILSLLKPFSSLWHLNLSNNAFTTIDGLGQMKKTFPDISSVDVNNNSLTCEWLKVEVDEAETLGVQFFNPPNDQKNYKWTTCL